jgi:hypothetical protein
MAVEVSLLVWKWSKQSGSRLLLLVAIADYANAEGIAWPSVKSLAQRTRQTPRYVQKMLREIEEDGELEIVKRTATSNVYRVTIRRPPSVQVEDELPFAPGVNPGTGGGRTPVREGGEPGDTLTVREPSNEPQPPAAQKKEDEVSLDAQAFVEWFLDLLGKTGAKITPLTPANRANWALCYDRLIRIDGRSKEQIRAVCEWARNDTFWKRNFMSPMKLRDKKDGVSYFDRFNNQLTNTTTNGNTSRKPNARDFENGSRAIGNRYDELIAEQQREWERQHPELVGGNG